MSDTPLRVTFLRPHPGICTLTGERERGQEKKKGKEKEGTAPLRSDKSDKYAVPFFGAPGKVVTAGFFDEEWKLTEKVK